MPPRYATGKARNSTSMVDLKVGIVNQKVAISMSRLDFAKLVVTCPAYLHLKIGHFCLVVNSINYVQIGVYYYHRYYQSAAAAAQT